MGLLDSLLTGGRRGEGGMSPMMLALLGLLAYSAVKGKGGLGGMFGQEGMSGQEGVPGQGGGLGQSGGLGDLLQGGLGSLLAGGAAGGLLSGGLQDLLKQFQDHGKDDKIQSWVSAGPNQPIDARELEETLGEEQLGWLTEQTGMSRADLLAGLSRELPEAVNRLTPEGHIPTEEEAQRLI